MHSNIYHFAVKSSVTVDNRAFEGFDKYFNETYMPNLQQELLCCELYPCGSHSLSK